MSEACDFRRLKKWPGGKLVDLLWLSWINWSLKHEEALELKSIQWVAWTVDFTCLTVNNSILYWRPWYVSRMPTKAKPTCLSAIVSRNLYHVQYHSLISSHRYLYVFVHCLDPSIRPLPAILDSLFSSFLPLITRSRLHDPTHPPTPRMSSSHRYPESMSQQSESRHTTSVSGLISNKYTPSRWFCD